MGWETGLSSGWAFFWVYTPGRQVGYPESPGKLVVAKNRCSTHHSMGLQGSSPGSGHPISSRSHGWEPEVQGRACLFNMQTPVEVPILYSALKVVLASLPKIDECQFFPYIYWGLSDDPICKCVSPSDACSPSHSYSLRPDSHLSPLVRFCLLWSIWSH